LFDASPASEVPVSDATVLTLDLGTSATKAGLWSGRRLAALARVPIATQHPRAGWAEQDPTCWWSSVVEACAQLRSVAPGAYAAVRAIGFAAARESFVLVDNTLTPLGPGILWSDQRAGSEAERLGDAGEFRARTGVVLNPATQAAKLLWVRENRAKQFAEARWVLAPRDLVVARLTGEVVTDPSLASRTGWFAIEGGGWTSVGLDAAGERLPPVRPSTTMVDGLLREVAHDLRLDRDVGVVLGAGDRACEALGVGATEKRPMVSWGTTANVSVPLTGGRHAPTEAQISVGALGGHVQEAGLSSSGAAIGWLESMTGWSRDDLMTAAAEVQPGALGLIALAWLNGARAPWWRADTHAAFVGLTAGHGPAELARALVEAVALDVTRCLELLAPDARELALAGGGAGDLLWRSVLAACARKPVVRQTFDEAASVGARIVVGAALGEPLDVDELNRIVTKEEPEAALIDAYREVRTRSDTAATAVLQIATDTRR
jgi:sugar (pentulose or hexulose) kinase